MAKKTPFLEAKNPLILRSHRLMEAFAKSDDERDFYLDKQEGFILYADLDQAEETLQKLQTELEENSERYILIPKMSFYETKKIMEGFIHEKVYDIDTKEKLMDIISAREAREQFLEFLYDQHAELEKWQQYYHEKSRIRIIEWLRANHIVFVFEEDLDLGVPTVEKLKHQLFEEKVPKEIAAARKALAAKAKTYYSSEALNPRPKRGRPPKQAQKTEVEPQISVDIYTTVPAALRPFLFTPDVSHAGATLFSAKFDTEEALIAHRKTGLQSETKSALESLNEKLEQLRRMTGKWNSTPELVKGPSEEELVLEEEPLDSAPKKKTKKK